MRFRSPPRPRHYPVHTSEKKFHREYRNSHGRISWRDAKPSHDSRVASRRYRSRSRSRSPRLKRTSQSDSVSPKRHKNGSSPRPKVHSQALSNSLENNRVRKSSPKRHQRRRSRSGSADRRCKKNINGDTNECVTKDRNNFQEDKKTSIHNTGEKDPKDVNLKPYSCDDCVDTTGAENCKELREQSNVDSFVGTDRRDLGDIIFPDVDCKKDLCILKESQESKEKSLVTKDIKKLKEDIDKTSSSLNDETGDICMKKKSRDFDRYSQDHDTLFKEKSMYEDETILEDEILKNERTVRRHKKSRLEEEVQKRHEGKHDKSSSRYRKYEKSDPYIRKREHLNHVYSHSRNDDKGSDYDNLKNYKRNTRHGNYHSSGSGYRIVKTDLDHVEQKDRHHTHDSIKHLKENVTLLENLASISPECTTSKENKMSEENVSFTKKDGGVHDYS